MIIIYTGNGKGKTTASLGLMLRALGANKKVAILQFMKKANSSEYKAIEKYRLPIFIKCYGVGFYKIHGDKKPDIIHQKAAQKALDRCKALIVNGKYDLIILDEINVAIDMKLIDIDEVLLLFDNSQNVDFVLTGRNAHTKLKKRADLITEMKAIKHPFQKGTTAKKGIDY